MYAEIGLACTIIGVGVPIAGQVYKPLRAIIGLEADVNALKTNVSSLMDWRKESENAKLGERISRVEGRFDSGP